VSGRRVRPCVAPRDDVGRRRVKNPPPCAGGEHRAGGAFPLALGAGDSFPGDSPVYSCGSGRDVYRGSGWSKGRRQHDSCDRGRPVLSGSAVIRGVRGCAVAGPGPGERSGQGRSARHPRTTVEVAEGRHAQNRRHSTVFSNGVERAPDDLGGRTSTYSKTQCTFIDRRQACRRSSHRQALRYGLLGRREISVRADARRGRTVSGGIGLWPGPTCVPSTFHAGPSCVRCLRSCTTAP